MTKIENIINKTSSQVGIYIGLFYMQIYLAYSITINIAICDSMDSNKNNAIFSKEV